MTKKSLKSLELFSWSQSSVQWMATAVGYSFSHATYYFSNAI